MTEELKDSSVEEAWKFFKSKMESLSGSKGKDS